MKKQLLTILLSLFTTILVAQISHIEKQALLDFYVATNGKNWVKTWNIEEPVTKWHGITVEDNKVTGISLLFNNIEGVLPASIGNLENLKVLELSFNKISGTIPLEIGKLDKLNLLALNGNNLSGNIPSSIGNLKALKYLHVSSNTFDGTLPITIGNLSNLEILNVFDNNLTGTLPIGLLNSKKIKKIIIDANEIIDTEAYASLLLFNKDSNFNPNTSLLPSAKSIIAIETSDDN
jgi:Leucine-rich repeat (LRR) protein